MEVLKLDAMVDKSKWMGNKNCWMYRFGHLQSKT